MQGEYFDFWKRVEVAWEVNNSTELLLEAALKSCYHFSENEPWENISFTCSELPDTTVFTLSREQKKDILCTVKEGIGLGQVNGTFVYEVKLAQLYAAFDHLSFGKEDADTVEVIIRLKYSGQTKSWLAVHCTYNVHTRTVYLDKSTLTSECQDMDGLEDFIHGYVNMCMESFYTDSKDRFLMEEICEKNGISLGRCMRCDRIGYREGRYEFEIPFIYHSIDADVLEKLPYTRDKNGNLVAEWLHSLYWLPQSDPKFLNQKYMIRRDPQLRMGIKVVENFQRKMGTALNEYEAYTRSMNRFLKKCNYDNSLM